MYVLFKKINGVFTNTFKNIKWWSLFDIIKTLIFVIYITFTVIKYAPIIYEFTYLIFKITIKVR